MKTSALLCTAAVLSLNLIASAEQIPTKVLHDQLPSSKQTDAKLYLTAEEAYDVWKSNPENTRVIDVRTVHEYVFIGHPKMAHNVPFMFATREWDQAENRYVLKPNGQFLGQVKAIADTDDLLLVTCRSGQRSKGAADVLTEAGYKNAYSIVDGFEGDKVKDPDSQFLGQRKKNGWRNAGLPWTYSLDPELVFRGEE